MSTPFDLTKKLDGVRKFGRGIGLHRMAWLRDALDAGGWLSRLDAVKVTGSNGKGSVCAMVAAIFEHLPVRYGLYTSPHLLHFRERIVVDGEPISDEELEEAWDFVEGRMEEYRTLHPEDGFGAFEVFTALALRHFSLHEPDLLITEAGIGGRYDSTRTIPGSLVALTSLDLEHTALLGNELELIAYDKADLCPDGGTLVVGGGIDPAVLRRLQGYARTRGIRLVAVDQVCRLLECRWDGPKMVVDMKVGERVLEGTEIALAGRHQWSNAAVAILLAELWVERHLAGLEEDVLVDAVRNGLREVSLPGRFQRVSSDPEVYVDVGHTPEAARALVRAVREALPGRLVLLVTGVSEDKLAEEILPELLQAADGVVCTRAWHRGSPVERIEGIVRENRPDLPRWRAETVEEGMALACGEAQRRGWSVLVAGGLFLSVEASEVLGGRDPRRLRFF